MLINIQICKCDQNVQIINKDHVVELTMSYYPRHFRSLSVIVFNINRQI